MNTVTSVGAVVLKVACDIFMDFSGFIFNIRECASVSVSASVGAADDKFDLFPNRHQKYI